FAVVGRAFRWIQVPGDQGTSHSRRRLLIVSSGRKHSPQLLGVNVELVGRKAVNRADFRPTPHFCVLNISPEACSYVLRGRSRLGQGNHGAHWRGLLRGPGTALQPVHSLRIYGPSVSR